MRNSNLPADPTAMILGVIALILSLVGCCCGLFAFIPLILSVIGLVIAHKSLQTYRYNSELYNPQSRSNVYTAKILNIIALIISAGMTLVYVAYFAIYGVVFSEIIKEAYEHRNENGDFQFEWENDSLNEDYNRDLERDSIYMDSIIIDETEMLNDNSAIDTLN